MFGVRFLDLDFIGVKAPSRRRVTRLYVFIVQSRGVVLEPDQHGGQRCARRQLFEWYLMGMRCDHPGEGTEVGVAGTDHRALAGPENPTIPSPRKPWAADPRAGRR